MISGDPDIKRGIVKRMHARRNQPKGPCRGVTKDPVENVPWYHPEFQMAKGLGSDQTIRKLHATS